MSLLCAGDLRQRAAICGASTCGYSVKCGWFRSMVFLFSALMSAREISADSRKYAAREGDDR